MAAKFESPAPLSLPSIPGKVSKEFYRQLFRILTIEMYSLTPMPGSSSSLKVRKIALKVLLHSLLSKQQLVLNWNFQLKYLYPCSPRGCITVGGYLYLVQRDVTGWSEQFFLRPTLTFHSYAAH